MMSTEIAHLELFTPTETNEFQNVHMDHHKQISGAVIQTECFSDTFEIT